MGRLPLTLELQNSDLRRLFYLVAKYPKIFSLTDEDPAENFEVDYREGSTYIYPLGHTSGGPKLKAYINCDDERVLKIDATLRRHGIWGVLDLFEVPEKVPPIYTNRTIAPELLMASWWASNEWFRMELHGDQLVPQIVYAGDLLTCEVVHELEVEQVLRLQACVELYPDIGVVAWLIANAGQVDPTMKLRDHPSFDEAMKNLQHWRTHNVT